MKLGFTCGTAKRGAYSIDDYAEEITHAETLGFDQAWMAQVFGVDAISMMTLMGRACKTIRLGTAVTPSFPRHPTSLAMQALTANAASNGRFELGLGLSHKMVIEDMFGIPYAKPAAHMREYLEVLMPLARGEPCDFRGAEYQVNTRLNIPAATPMTVIVAALGPRMLDIAGRLADGTITWMVGPRTLASYTIPAIQRAAQQAGKPAPRIVAGFPIVLTDDVDAARATLAKRIAVYRDIPSYRQMLDREDVDSAVDIAMLGNEAALREQLLHLRSIGVTDFNAFCFAIDEGSVSRTMEFLASEKSALRG